MPTDIFVYALFFKNRLENDLSDTTKREKEGLFFSNYVRYLPIIYFVFSHTADLQENYSALNIKWMDM